MDQKFQPLLFTTQGRGRVLAGLRWDVREGKATIMDKLRGTNQQYDLDLSCFVFDDQGDYIDYIGAMAQDAVGHGGAVYHSGDDNTGEGGGDDETISCELAQIDGDVRTIIFVAEIRSNHTFADIDASRFRLADGATDKNLYEVAISDGRHEDKSACVLCAIRRDDLSETGWALQPIEDYPALSDIEEWGSWLSRYSR